MIERDEANKGFVVTMQKPFGIYKVYFRLDAKVPKFEEYDFVVVSGDNNLGDQKFFLRREADKVLRIYIAKSFAPSRKFNLTERTIIAFYAGAAKALQESRNVCISPKGLSFVQSCATSLSDKIGEIKTEARCTGEKASYNFHILKANAITSARKEKDCSDEERDFYSSIVGTAFSWRSGTIPVDDLKLARAIMPPGIINM